MKIAPSIFRAYDIRGVVDHTLNTDILFTLGKAIASQALDQGIETLLTGRDGRLSGPEFLNALNRGISSTGCHAVDLGMVPSPLLYFAAHHSQHKSGVILTGSHNPADHNGLKIVLGGETLSTQKIWAIYERIQKNTFFQGCGEIRQHNIEPDYCAAFLNNLKLSRPLKIVIDCGNGVCSALAPELFKTLGCDVIPLFCEVDGNFPNHHPDPSKPENLQELVTAVLTEKADVGIAFDGDGDRLGLVNANGEIIWPDQLLVIFSEEITQKNPATTIVFDVKCSTILSEKIRNLGAQGIMWKTGHSLIKAKMKEENALLAGEMSGHIYFADRWYGFDDALYAAGRALEIISAYPHQHSPLENLPQQYTTPEITLPLPEGENFKLVEKMQRFASFGDNAKIISLDGIRVEFDKSWGLLRASNTTSAVVLRFEGATATELKKIKRLFREQLQIFLSSTEIPNF